jgi:REP element-mobilizing transposase RayT
MYGMARKLRLEFPGARYHVINRGNYRSEIFQSDRTKAAFENCLIEAAEKWAWLLHAFIIMRNHFHLALETPLGNLVRGMQWLEATFSCRFNRLRRENGHLFQGRYKALLIGDEYYLGLVCDYIHLNPVRAGFQPLATLAEYRHSSYWHLHHPTQRPKPLVSQTALTAAGGLHDNPSGWLQYAEHLSRELAESDNNKRHYVDFAQGWAIGSDAFKAATIAKFAPPGSARAWTLPGAQQMRAAHWELNLEKALSAIGHTLGEARSAPKSESWKLAVATWMRDATRAKNSWLSDRLVLGQPSVLSRNLTRYRCLHQPSDPTWARLTSTFAT